MQEKQKVTLYIPPELHRKLKIQAAVKAEPMSSIAERALAFMLEHPEVVEGVESSCGGVHQIYQCPECSTATVLRAGELVALKPQASVLAEDVVRAEAVSSEPLIPASV